MDFTLELPLNQTGLGQVGIGVAVECFDRGLYPNIFVIGEPSFEYTNVPPDFIEWFKFCTSKALKGYKRDQPSVKLWHIHDSRHKPTDRAVLSTVHELDSITVQEKNILSQYDKVLVPSNYTKKVFEAQGLNAGVAPNFYDPRVFSKVKAPRKGLEDVTIFGLFGKMEKRKRTADIIKAWVTRFGGDKNYRLNCHVFNGYVMQGYKIAPKDYQIAHRQLIEQAIGMKVPWNVEFYGFQTKEEFNLSMNVIDIDLTGLSGGEGFNLPCFYTKVLGKRGVVLNAHAHQDYCNNENSVLIEPNGKEDAADGVFFQKGSVFNQGNIFTFSQEDAVRGMEEALERPEPDEKLGEELKEKFSAKNCVDRLLEF
jgi:hypothetical protein